VRMVLVQRLGRTPQRQRLQLDDERLELGVVVGNVE
jgi:hypothetical protein